MASTAALVRNVSKADRGALLSKKTEILTKGDSETPPYTLEQRF